MSRLIKTTEGTLTLLRTSEYDIRSIDEERTRILNEAVEAAAGIRAEAVEILAKTKALLQEAREDAKRIRHEAGLGAEEEGYARGEKAGRTEGEAKALEAARQRADAEQAALTETLTALLDTVSGERQRLVAAARADLIRLAVSVAEKICKVEVKTQDAIVIKNVETAVELAAKRSDIEIRVHPDDLNRVEAYVPALAARLGRTEAMAVAAQEEVESGGCVVVHDTGRIDAAMATQLLEIERHLLGSDDSPHDE